jgi:hypothetical protein
MRIVLIFDSEGGGKKKRKAKPAMAPLQSGSFPYHPEEEYIDKVGHQSYRSRGN